MELKLHRITAIYIRHIVQIFSDVGRLLSAFYWPLLDIILWGFTATWFQSTTTENLNLALLTIAAAVFWQVSIRANLEISMQLIEEIWARNVTNLFATPLTIGEWICAGLLIGLTMAVILSIFGMAAAWFIYGINLFAYWHIAIPMVLLLYAGGIWTGFFASSLVLRFGGERMQTIAFILGWFFTPLSGAYYDISVMPAWVQAIARSLPMVYIFEGMREAFNTGNMPIKKWSIAAILCVVYITLSLWFFVTMFHRSRERGLARLDE